MDSSDPYQKEFADIGLSNFIITHKRVARCKLERLELTPFQSSLLSRGIQQKMDDQEPKGKFCCFLLLVSLVNPLLDLVLKVALGYTRAIGTLLMDELASLDKRCDLSVVDIKMEDLDRRIIALIDEGIRDCEAVRMMGVEERERSQRWNERAVLETRRLEGEIESLLDESVRTMVS